MMKEGKILSIIKDLENELGFEFVRLKINEAEYFDYESSILYGEPNTQFFIYFKELWLCITHCSLKNLPEIICDLPLLERLKLNNNRLEILPHSFSKLEELVDLNLSSNYFTEIPEVIV